MPIKTTSSLSSTENSLYFPRQSQTTPRKISIFRKPLPHSFNRTPRSKMHPTTHLFALLALITIAAATNHDVSVGSDSYVYAPDSVTAAPDDTVTFHFYPGNHSVVQSDFDSPCSSSNGIFSGYVNSESGASSTTFVVTITDTNPIWLFCSQTEHCQSGMVMVINPP